jgi:hypothetical protein
MPPRALIGGGVASIVVADMAFRSSGTVLPEEGRTRGDVGRTSVDLDGYLAREGSSGVQSAPWAQDGIGEM